MTSVDGGFWRRLRWVNRSLGPRTLWWVAILLGVACVSLGMWLVAAPFRSESTLRWLIAAGMLLSGVAEVASSSTARRPTLARVIGASWVLTGLVVFVVTSLTLYGIALVVGGAIVVGGLIRVGDALTHRGNDRAVQLLAGITNVLGGVLAVGWPAVTLLVLAIVFGVRTIVVGLVEVWSGLSARRGRVVVTPDDRATTAPTLTSRWRLVGAIAAFAVLAGATMISAAVNRVGPTDADAFYDQPDTLPDGPLGPSCAPKRSTPSRLALVRTG